MLLSRCLSRWEALWDPLQMISDIGDHGEKTLWYAHERSNACAALQVSSSK